MTVLGGADGAGNGDVNGHAHGKDANHYNDVFGLARPRLSILIPALAPTLSQRDFLLANVVANGLQPLTARIVGTPFNYDQADEGENNKPQD